jgi:hypothetical protein
LLIPVITDDEEIDADAYEEIGTDEPRYVHWVAFIGASWEQPLPGLEAASSE